MKKQADISLIYSKLLRKTLSFAISLTTLLTLLTKKTLIFSTLVDQIPTKMLKIKVENGIPMKTSLYFIDLHLVFKKNLVICNDSNEAFKTVY